MSQRVNITHYIKQHFQLYTLFIPPADMTKMLRNTAGRRAQDDRSSNADGDSLSPPPVQGDSATPLNNQGDTQESSEEETEVLANLVNEGKGESSKSKPKGKSKAK